MASHHLRIPATEIPLIEDPRKQILPIKFDKSRWQGRRSQNGRMDRAGAHDQSTAGMLYKREDEARDLRIACVKTALLFRGLSQPECYEIVDAAQELQFSHRQTIFRQDDPVRFVYLVATGIVKVTQLSEGGKEVILRVDRRGSLIDDLTGALQVHTSSAYAIHSCRVLAWDVVSFDDFAERFPVIHRNATSIMRGRLRMLEERFCDVTTQRVAQRLAKLLIHLAGQTSQGALDPISLSREELSQMTGTSLFTVSRLLSLWAESDILTVDRKAVLIEDLPRLLRTAQAGAA